jgi:hypothetical protein
MTAGGTLGCSCRRARRLSTKIPFDRYQARQLPK